VTGCRSPDIKAKMQSISIIIPTFNRIDTLPRAISSVLAQEYKQWELLIIDDGSTDNTLAWLQEFKQKSDFKNQIKIITTKNNGVSAARNRAVMESNFDWISFLDSDDEWLPKKLNLQSELMEKFSIIHGEEIWIRNGVRVNPMKKHKKSGGRIFLKCIPLCCISPSTVLMQKELFNKFGGFRKDFPVCEDYDLWLKICAEYEIGFVESPVIKKYGGHEDQLSRKYFAMDYWRVKSLWDCLHSSTVSGEDKVQVEVTLTKKIKVLLKGSQKHNNSSYIDEIQRYLSKLEKRKISLLK
jgi:glycosyltransferase involved in cell wall biosynthesis